MTSPSRRAEVVGLGLIGGSIGLALRGRGWHVSGRDLDARRAAHALSIRALDRVGADPIAEIAFVATPASAVPTEARRLVAAGPTERVAGHVRAVTDVAGVKAQIVAEVDEPTFVGGHPMAGSEQEGLDGADADLFEGATWVLTPTASTDSEAFSTVSSVVSSLGADVVALEPDRHDTLVAMVSHVPHLTAATLMGLAADTAEEHAALLRLAAGGFRDMTRIAAGHPGIWPDICTDNSAAILVAFDALLERLTDMRAIVATGDRLRLTELLEHARGARRNLPLRGPRPETTVEFRVPVPDRPGVLAEVTTLIGELGVNIYDLEIAHSSEGPRGVLVMAVDGTAADKVRRALTGRGYRPSVGRME
jgi:prephenate dehydrogenase